MPAVYQDRLTGKRVLQVGARTDDEFVLVKAGDGAVYYASMVNLLPCDAQGTPDFDGAMSREVESLVDEAIPPPIIELPETRLNVNTATPEELARRVKGIGYRIAKRIKEVQMSQPGERFRTLEQLRSASTRVNWDEVFRSNVLFIG